MISKNKQKLLSCSKCPYFTTRQSELNRHEEIHGTGAFKCSNNCGSVFKTISAAEQHEINCEPNTDSSHSSVRKPKSQLSRRSSSVEDPVEKKITAELIANLRAISEHKKSSGSSSSVFGFSQKQFKCTKCMYKTSRYFDFTRHKLTHGDFYKCAYCTASFGTVEGYEDHKTTHIEYSWSYKRLSYSQPKITKKTTEVRDGRYCCPKCDQTFTVYSNMARHHRFYHTEERSFQCDKCDSTFKRKDYWIHHERNCTITPVNPRKNSSYPSQKFQFNDDEEFGNMLEEINYDRQKKVKKAPKKKKKKLNFGCVECELYFESSLELWDHLRIKHLL